MIGWTTNAWHVYDLLEPLVSEVLVANPIKVKQIACGCVKTDKKDTLILVRLLAVNLVPTVWGPPKQVRELRQWVSHRRRLANMHTQVVNRMHSVAHLISGPLADYVFEPLMRDSGALTKTFLGTLLGTGPGRGIGLMFVIAGLLGIIVSGIAYLNRHIRNIETELPDVISGD